MGAMRSELIFKKSSDQTETVAQILLCLDCEAQIDGVLAKQRRITAKSSTHGSKVPSEK